MAAALRAGSAYFALVFLAGAMLGPVRLFFLQPRLGGVAAVLVELPFMLAASWLACRFLVGRFRVPPEAGARLAMGGVAFLMLMLAEIGLTLSIGGGTLFTHFAAYRGTAAKFGLLGQAVFAALPFLSACLDGNR